MEEHYSVQFFTSFVEHLQEVCRNYLNYKQFVEVSGYVCVEIDNMKKERYVLSELLQSSGNVVSESYCTKAFLASRNGRRSWNPDESYTVQERTNENTCKRKPLKQSRELNTGGSDQHSVLSSSGTFISDTVNESEESSFHEKQISFPRQHPDVQLQHDLGPSTSDYAESFASTSSETASAFLQDEVIDLDTDDDDLDLQETMETASSEDYSESTVSPQSSNFSGARKSPLSPGTLVTVRNSVRKFCKFHFDKHGENVDLLSTPPEKLNQLLLEYCKGAQKITGGALTATTLKSVQKHLDMYLKDKGYPYAIGKSRQFQSSREYLKKKLSEMEKSVAQKHSPVNNDDIETLFQKYLLGVHSSESLINTMWFLNTKYFGIRKPAEHFNMKWGDIKLKVNEEGQEYLERQIHGTFSLKVCAKPDMPDRCFVNVYKQYRAMRPKIMLDEDSSFYLRTQKNCDVWFLPQPATYCSFTYMWRKILTSAGLPSDKRVF